MRQQRSSQDPENLLNKYFEEVDIEKMQANEKLLSAFGQYHIEQDQIEFENVKKTGDLKHEFFRPVEGLDYYIEDSVQETYKYQQMHSEFQEYKVTHLFLEIVP